MSAIAGCGTDPFTRGSWENLPRELLAHVIEHVDSSVGDTSGLAALRLTCQQWRESIDSNVLQLQLRRWPEPCPAGGVLRGRFSSVRALDTTRCSLQQVGVGYGAGVGDIAMIASCARSGAPMRCQWSDTSSEVPSPVAQRCQCVTCRWDFHKEAQAVARSLMAAKTSSQQLAVINYIAARYPEALPCVTPVAADRIWQELSGMHLLQHLAVGGAMLALRSISSSVQQPRTASAADSDDLAEPAKIIHVYTFELPEALCCISSLQSLMVEWYIPEPESSSSSSVGCSGATCLGSSSKSSLSFPGRRRSYERSPAPMVFHTADPVLHLPPQLTKLTNLQQLTLAASITNPSALNPLLGLPNLQVLALGPGELDVRALLALARGGVLRGLKRLVLQQQGRWDAVAFAAMLGGMHQLQELVVVEFEVCSPHSNAVIPPEQHLNPDHVAPLAATLHTLAWTTCSQRLSQGSSMLCTPAAITSAAVAAAGAWVGGCTALQHLQLAGSTGAVGPCSGSSRVLSQRPSVVSAPVIDMLHHSIGLCKGLEVLVVQGVGVPVLPQGLAQLYQLHTVRIESTRVARRAHRSADRALAVLGLCRGLRDLTLAGCELRSLPTWISGLQHLSSLNLQANYLQELPGCSPGLALPLGLQTLNLSDNRLRVVPEGLADLSSLKQLILDDNYLCSLPQQVWQLPHLTELSVRENMLSLLPELPSSTAVGEPSAAPSAATEKTKRAAGAVATSVRAGIYCAVSSSRRYRRKPAPVAAAAAEPKSGTREPSSVVICRELKVLDLGCNQLSELPMGVSLLTSLQDLDLGHNQLGILPESGSLWALTRLTALQLSHNHIKKLPAALSNLQQLVNLDISGNHLPASSSSQKRPAAESATAVVDSGTPAAESTAAVQRQAPQHPRINCSSSNRLTAAEQRRLPGPLRALRHLQQLRMGGQQQDYPGGHQCPLQLLLGGLADIIEVVRSLAPPHHQCPVSKAAAAAVARLSRISTGRRGRKERARQLAERLRFEPGWVLLSAPKGRDGAAGGAAGAAAGAGVSGW